MKNRKGFTIVELVIVIAVIAILAAVLIPTFSGVIQRANESSSLQTATSAMKTVLAQSQSATIADGSFFCVGDKEGVKYVYKFDNQKMETENLYDKSNKSLYGKQATINGSPKGLNTLILPVKNETVYKGDEVLAILSDILGKEVKAADIIEKTTPDANDNSEIAKAIRALATNTKYFVNIDLDDDSSKVAYVGILTNVDFAKDIVVFTYSK